MSESKQHPVLAGLVALAGVGTLLGVILGVGVWVGAGALGLRGSEAPSEPGAGTRSLVIPKYQKTTAASDPLVTLEPGQEAAGGESEAAASPTVSKTAKKARAITLSAAQTQVGPMQQIDLSGSYSTGDGAVLQVQRLSGDTWLDFPVTASVSGGTYSTYVQTSQPGANKFRMLDAATGKASNPIAVTVG